MLKRRLKILSVMNNITSKISWSQFTERVGLTPSQTTQALKELMKEGFVKKVEQGYSLTEKGKIALKALEEVPKDMEFHFYTGIGQYTGASAKNFQDFCEVIKKVDPVSLEFHISRGDFENWVKGVFQDSQLANEFGRIRQLQYKGEELRSRLLEVTEQTYYKFRKSLSKS